MNIAVYCSSSNHITKDYLQSAEFLGNWIAKNGHTLIFGGATGGSMTAVSEGAFNYNGTIIGVIPDAVIKMNRQSPYCSTLISVQSMDERKAKMKELSEMFIALPGSYGTLDELFDVIASGVVGEHKKPVVIVNQNGIYDNLLKLTLRMKEEKFIPTELFQPVVTNNIQECIEYISKYSLNLIK